MDLSQEIAKIAQEGWLASVGCVMDRNGFSATITSNSCDFYLSCFSRESPSAAFAKALEALDHFARRDLTVELEPEPEYPPW